jgi:hypothetical protein
MQLNNHFAIGLILASVTHHFFNFDLFEIILIVGSSFVCDFDVLFTKYALDNNHRNLFTHSIIPSVIITVIGAIIHWPALIFSGISYALHILVDTLDWGTNFLYFGHHNIGLRLLISKEEQDNLDFYLNQYNRKASFFDFKRYNNKLWISMSVVIFLLMILFVFIYALDYFYLIIFYFIALGFHLYKHFSLKKIETS